MKANRSVDTKPEIQLRKQLHAVGLRFRKNKSIDFEGGRANIDIVFTRRMVAVFIDGCFWHGCPDHCRVPASNRQYWLDKFERNRRRDSSTNLGLARSGWVVVRLWEHIPVIEMINRVLRFVEPGRDNG